MRYSVCIIDNDIPAAGSEAQVFGIKDSELLNSSNLQLLLAKETWTDNVIKNLTSTLLNQKDDDGISAKWDVFGFTNPSFYVNTIDNGFFRSDLVIFDWEYPGAQVGSGTDSESVLKEILDRTFSLVFIFSKADKKAEIEEIFDKPEFQEYRERLAYLDKTVADIDQTSILIQKAETMYANNFSFRFASILRKKAVQTIDKILSDMGRASLNDIKNQIIVGDSGKKDFIDFLAERFRAAIAGKEIYDLVDQIPDPAMGNISSSQSDDENVLEPVAEITTVPNNDMTSKVWSSRLYFNQESGDDLVRRGDIVTIENDFFFVISADCDLSRFWKKNFGIINMVALYELNSTNSALKNRLTTCVNLGDIPGKPNSLLDKIGRLVDGPCVLPFVPINNLKKNFIFIPKDIISKQIDLSTEFDQLTKKQKGDKALEYTNWPNANRVCTLSEPFLTPAIHHVLNNIGGHGVPDYPDHMGPILKKILDDFIVNNTVPGPGN